MRADDPDAWLRSLRVDEDARQRAQRRWMELRATADSTISGVLVALADRSMTCCLRLVVPGPDVIRGTVVGVGTDFVAVRTAGIQPILVRLAAVESVESEGTAAIVGTDPSLLGATSLAGVLEALSAERELVRVRTLSGRATEGSIEAATADVVHLRIAGPPRRSTWIRLDHVATTTLI